MSVVDGVREGASSPSSGPSGASGGVPGSGLTPRMRLTLVVLLVAQFMLAVDFSILNVALPVIGQGLGFALSNLQWIATAFALCAAGFTLMFGRVADLFGRRRLFLGGLAVLGPGIPGRRPRHQPRDAHRRPRLPGPGHRRRHPGRTLPADHVLPRRTAAAKGARPQRRPDVGRIHHRRDPRRRPDRPPLLAVGVLHQRPRRSRCPDHRPDGHHRVPPHRTPQAGPARRPLRHPRPAGPRLRLHPGRRARLGAIPPP